MGEIISVVNAKGGVGKTTVTVNLAHALARLKKSVLVIDIDSQSNTSKRFLPPKAENYYEIDTLRDWLDPQRRNQINPEDIVQPTLIKNLYVVLNGRTTGIERAMIEHRAFKGIHKLRPFIKSNYEFCLIDCPPNMGVFVMNALFGSDFVVVPVMATSADSIEGLADAIKMIENIQENDNPELRFLRILVNQFSKRKAMSRYNVEKLQQQFKEDKIFETTIPENTSFHHSEAVRETVFQTSPKSIGCNAYRSLAKEVKKILHKQGR